MCAGCTIVCGCPGREAPPIRPGQPNKVPPIRLRRCSAMGTGGSGFFESRVTSHESRVTSHESRVTSHESRAQSRPPPAAPPPATGMGFAASCWLQAGGSHSCSEQARRPTSDAGLPSRVPSRVSGIRYQGRCLRHKINQVPILDSVANKRQGTPKDQRQWQPIRVRAPRY